MLNDASLTPSDTVPALNADQRAALDALNGDEEPRRICCSESPVRARRKSSWGLHRMRWIRASRCSCWCLRSDAHLSRGTISRSLAGQPIAVLHSGLTGAARRGYWDAIREGEARIVVGARSAIFAPFQRLGLVVVDEEHDDSYKQSEGVPYHGRDLAVVLARQHECPLILASATPSLESWVNDRPVGIALDLPRRATPRPVPSVDVIDRSTLPRGDGPAPLLAEEVVEALRSTFAQGGQAIVLYNRRGFATMVECTSCGATYECPNCGVTMTLHKKMGRVVCHYCGLKKTLRQHLSSLIQTRHLRGDGAGGRSASRSGWRSSFLRSRLTAWTRMSQRREVLWSAY